MVAASPAQDSETSAKRLESSAATMKAEIRI